MKTITHQNINVSNVPFKSIKHLFIEHGINRHGKAKIIGTITTKDANVFLERADEKQLIEITTTAENQPERLFNGVISNLELKKEAEFSEIILELETTSSRLDSKRNNQTFQQTSMTYNQLFQKVVGDNGLVTMLVSDKPIGALIMQYNETDFEFIIRMAAQLGSVVFTDILAQKPNLYIGVPNMGRARNIETIAFGINRNEQNYQNKKNNSGSAMREDFMNESVYSYDYSYVGDKLIVNRKQYTADSISAKLVDGILQCEYSVGRETSFTPSSSVVNKQATGRMLNGIVTAVEADKVKVFLNSVDKSDAGGDWWFPYSTAYSSQDGTGWYSMPEVGDEVRVFFPSDNEADAFAASSVAKNIRPSVKEKSFNGLNGKQLLMLEDGLLIISKLGRLYLKMNDETGIEIISDMDINITSGTKVNIQGGEEVKVMAEKEIILGTSGSYVDIREEQIIVTAQNVIIK